MSYIIEWDLIDRASMIHEFAMRRDNAMGRDGMIMLLFAMGT